MYCGPLLIIIQTSTSFPRLALELCRVPYKPRFLLLLLLLRGRLWFFMLFYHHHQQQLGSIVRHLTMA